MPTGFLDTDTYFPTNSGGEPTREKMQSVLDYLYMLQEQLRYALRNIGMENFNESEFIKIGEVITSPIMARVEDNEGNLAQLSLTAQDISWRVSNQEGQMSSLTQKVDSMTLSVSYNAQSSTIHLSSTGIALSSQQIRLTGLVSFYDLANPGMTTINGGNITTGTISAIDIEGVNIYGSEIQGATFRCILDNSGGVSGQLRFYHPSYNPNNPGSNLAASIRLDASGDGTPEDGQYRLFISTHIAGNNNRAFNLKLESSRNMSFASAMDIYVDAGDVLSLISHYSDVLIKSRYDTTIESQEGNIWLKAGYNVYIGKKTLQDFIIEVVSNYF